MPVVTVRPSETMPPARSWRARAADAAVADAGRADDPTTVTAARRLVDRGLAGAGLAIAILGLLGAIAGWTTTAELLKPADTPVHAPALLLIVVGTPWLLLGLRAIVLLGLRRRAMPFLGRLVPAGLSTAIARRRPAGVNAALATAITRRVGSVLANGSGRRLAAAGSGVFWTAFAAASIATLWLVTARVALGFGWESSWLPPQLGQAITEVAAAPLSSVVDAEALQPVAAPPTAPADDETALAARRAWIGFLTAGIGLYLLLPMLAWTVFNAAFGHWQAERWRPVNASLRRTVRTPDPAATRAATPSAATPSARRDGACTHLVHLERGDDAARLPECLDALTDLGQLDTASAIDDAGRAVATPDTRMIVLAWLPATPDRGVRRRLADLARTAAHPPVVLLDGGEQLRRRESAATSAMRLDDWRTLARELELPTIEADLANLTTESRALVERTIAGDAEGGATDATTPTADTILDPGRLDEALAAIGRGLDASDPLPGDDAHARAAREIATCLADAGGDRLEAWTNRLQAWRELDASDARARITALSEAGLELVPARLRQGVAWSALGGVLGATACLAAASVVPAALVAMPGWAGTGAGLAGLLSLARRPDSGNAASTATDADSNDARSLDDRVPALATLAVLLWSQGGDETRTTRLLDAVLPDDTLPNLPDADAARRWIGAMRQRVVDAAVSESSS